VEYTYDAWGKILTITGSMASTLGVLNPLRYRGYIYDTELGLYYLQSRYYNPAIGRFLNADSYASTGQGILGNNMFAYCNNSPVVFYDNAGTRAECVGIDFGAPAGFATPGALSYNTRSSKRIISTNDEQDVLDATSAVFYKGKLVIKVPGWSDGFSCGIIFIGNDAWSTDIVKHEYGHTQQLEELGFSTYLSTVVVPSVICYHLAQAEILSWSNYYNMPWEHKADQLGGVSQSYAPWSGAVSDAYWFGSQVIARLRF